MTGLQIPFTGIKKQYNNLRTEILDATDEVLRSGRLMDGNYTAELENWLAKKNSTKYAVTCHSCTQALEIIAEYYATQSYMPNPPRVLVPAMTYVATINAFRRAGWIVTIVDTDVYGQMDHKKIDREQSVQAIIAVGLYGQSLNRHDYLNNNAMVIEDGAQHWLSDACRRTGSVTAISFDPMKNLNSYGNGGAIVTDDVNMLDFARSWRNNGKPNHQMIGTNSRMSEVDCAQLMVKTRYIDEWQQRRSKIAGYWLERLHGTGVRTLVDESNHNTHAVNKFVIDVDNRDLLKRNLEIRRIETKILAWEPLHELPAYADFSGPDVLSVASSLSRRTLCLPIYPELTDLEVEYVIDSVLDCV
jgi:UDP-2-acetamido-2-deoxy-ribo-hexuluronate aminotransferase